MKKYSATFDGKEIPLEIEKGEGDVLTIRTEGKEFSLDIHKAGPHHYSVIHEGHSYDLRFFHRGDEVDAYWHGEHVAFKLQDARTAEREHLAAAHGGTAGIAGPAEIRAMMPGKVVAVKVKEGDSVKAGQGIVVLEAMKMENELSAPKDGKVTRIAVSEGQSVESGAVMAVIE